MARRFLTSAIASCALAANAAPAPKKQPAKEAKKPAAKAPEPLRTGTLNDSRNGKTYRTIVIGRQTWMAETLNFPTEGSTCYENQKKNCETYGRLYDWEAAKKACPSGWELPSDEQWTALVDGVGGMDSAGTALKARAGWSNNGNGTDSKGFSALPAGFLDKRGLFMDQGNAASFWSTSTKFLGGVWARQLAFEHNRMDRTAVEKTTSLSVRCIRSEL
jgi:uncharacterized protein (TIGR02145 family)